MIMSMPAILGSARRRTLESPYDWTARTMNIGTGPRGVTYDGSTYWVAVSSAGGGTSDIASSTDGITWTSEYANKNPMRDITNDGTTFCAIGDGGYMITATDPTVATGTWTSRTSGFGATDIQGVFYDGTTYWLAMGSSGKLTTATSATGTWTARTSSFGADLTRSAAFDGTTYVMVGGSGKLATCTDPTALWTQRTSSFGATTIRYVTENGAGRFVAVGNSGKIAYSDAPTSSWTQAVSPFGGGSIITTVQWDARNELFVAVSNASEIAISENGITWFLDAGGTANMWDLHYGAGVGFLVFVSDDGGGTGKTSLNIPTFTQRGSNFGANGVYRVWKGPTYWVIVGAAGKMDTAPDPTGAWTARTSSFGATNINSVSYGTDGYWVAVGSSGKLATATDPTGTWTQRTSSFGATHIYDAKYNGSHWVAVGDDGKLATATDPTGTWTQRTSSFGATDVRWVNWDGTYWVVTSLAGKIATATDPTGTWTQRTSGFGASNIQGSVYGADDGLWTIVGNTSIITTAPDPTGAYTVRGVPLASHIRTVDLDTDRNIYIVAGDAGNMAWATNTTVGSDMWGDMTSSFAGTLIYNIHYGDDGIWVATGAAGKIASGEY